MNKFVAVLAMLALVMGSVGANTAFAAPKDKPAKEKSNNRDNEHRKAGVLICHALHSMPTLLGIINMGKVIRVSESAVEAHLAHGDRLADEGAVKGDPCTWLADGG
jgi:hypothetical protein